MTRTMSATAIFLASIASSVSADQPVCATAPEMEAALIDIYGEYPQPGVVKTSTSTVQIWASPQTGTWTLVKYLIDGTACAIEEGDGYGAQGERAPALIAGLMD